MTYCITKVLFFANITYFGPSAYFQVVHVTKQEEYHKPSQDQGQGEGLKSRLHDQ